MHASVGAASAAGSVEAAIGEVDMQTSRSRYGVGTEMVRITVGALLAFVVSASLFATQSGNSDEMLHVVVNNDVDVTCIFSEAVNSSANLAVGFFVTAAQPFSRIQQHMTECNLIIRERPIDLAAAATTVVAGAS